MTLPNLQVSVQISIVPCASAHCSDLVQLEEYSSLRHEVKSYSLQYCTDLRANCAFAPVACLYC